MVPAEGDNVTLRIESGDEENVEIIVIRNLMNAVSQQKSSNIRDTDSICRVPLDLRRVNRNAYTPQFIAIGPLHDIKDNDPIVRNMKSCFIQRFADVAGVEWNEIVGRVIGCEKRATEFYKVAMVMSRADFLEILISDGCFVVMYILCFEFSKFGNLETSLFYWRFKDAIFRDLLLLENQLPFFLLQSLYDLCASNNQTIPANFSFIQLTHKFFMAREGMGYLGMDFRADDDKLAVNHFVHFISCYMNSLDHKRTDIAPSILFWPPTATELYNCGISFKKKSHYSEKMFDEHDGILRVPHIIINESFESRMRNIIAYEHCHRESQVVSNFVMFMHFLVNTDNDASLLIKEGIIHNQLESTKEVTKLFHDLCQNVVVETYLYDYESNEMRKFCMVRWHYWIASKNWVHRRNRWMASLKQDYFNTPWALISFIAAVLLLLLTILQAVVAVLSMPKSK